jgi:predicted TIM-barrel fold metal-dependent hydrolase
VKPLRRHPAPDRCEGGSGAERRRSPRGTAGAAAEAERAAAAPDRPEREATPRADDVPIVDAHQHFWDLSLGKHPWLRADPPPPFRYGDTRSLRRTYLPADYFADARGHRVVATVYVEAEWDPGDPVGETRWVHELADREGVPDAVVAQAWLDRADVEDVLARQAAFPRVRGVRHKPRAAAAPSAAPRGAAGSMSDPVWRAGYARLAGHGLHFELQVPWWHLPEAAALARAFPETPLVLNHAGLPGDRSPEALAGWRRAMAVLAAEPNTAVKISGLGVPGQPWTAETNREVVLDTIALFGVDRCMFASNFPVDGLVASLDTIFSGFKAIVADFAPGDRRKLFHDNAVRLYRLDGGAG